MKISFKTILSAFTLVMVVLILFLSRNHLRHAWQLMSQVNLWMLGLVGVFTLVSYLLSGEMIFSYLRQKKFIKGISHFTQMRISLELNFVNHVLPSGGVSGMSYFNWRMGKSGVNVARSTMAQIVRFVASAIALTILLVISLVIVTIDGEVNRWMILMSATLVFLMAFAIAIFIYIIQSSERIARLGAWMQKKANKITRVVTRGKRRKVIDSTVLTDFLEEMHQDYIELSRDRSIMKKPIIWGLWFFASDVAIFFLTFLALGLTVNPASILIAYSIASLAGFVVVTPGGAGAYEALMVWVLVASGVREGQAIAGILLARVVILMITIVAGYFFYQLTLNKYGKRSSDISSQ